MDRRKMSFEQIVTAMERERFFQARENSMAHIHPLKK